jgi:hypothetical protein
MTGRAWKLAVMVGLFNMGSLGCVSLTPAESCAAICDELQECDASIRGSSLAPGPSCRNNCEALLEAQGDVCQSSAAYLADCFQTYTCAGIDFCGEKAGSFSSDCS